MRKEVCAVPENRSAVLKDADGIPVAQIDLIHNELTCIDSVRLYTPKGFLLAEMDYTGGDELGHMLGVALYQGYVAGREKREYEMRMFMEQAFRTKGDFAV
jgi:hypothetical protein